MEQSRMHYSKIKNRNQVWFLFSLSLRCEKLIDFRIEMLNTGGKILNLIVDFINSRQSLNFLEEHLSGFDQTLLHFSDGTKVCETLTKLCIKLITVITLSRTGKINTMCINRALDKSLLPRNLVLQVVLLQNFNIFLTHF